MKCVKIADAKKMEISKLEIPVSKNGSVVIKVDSCGICGSDIHYWVGGQPKGLVMGHEFAGTVVDNGSRSDLKIGDRVTGLPISPCGECEPCKSGNPQYCKKTWSEAIGLSLTNPGGYAEYTSSRPDMIRKLPDNVSFKEGAMVEPSSVALHAINLSSINNDSNVLIIGGGIIGLMCAEFAKYRGAKYVALLETNPKRGNKAIRYKKVDEYYSALEQENVQKLVEKTNGGFDTVVDCCGNSPAVSEAIMTVKPGGEIILVGVSMVPITIPTVMAVMGEVKMQGAIAYTPEEFDNVIDLISKKEIDVTKYIDDVVPLEKAQESFERLTNGNDDAIKIVFKP